MNKKMTVDAVQKRAWIKPELVKSGLNLEDVKFGYAAGTDGLGSPFSTSLTS